MHLSDVLILAFVLKARELPTTVLIPRPSLSYVLVAFLLTCRLLVPFRVTTGCVWFGSCTSAQAHVRAHTNEPARAVHASCAMRYLQNVANQATSYAARTPIPTPTLIANPTPCTHRNRTKGESPFLPPDRHAECHPRPRDHASGDSDVLEIGFGCGYSADRIQEFSPRSHTVVEPDPTVLDRLKGWAEGRPGVRVVEGFWQAVLPALGRYDAVFFDDFPVSLDFLFFFLCRRCCRCRRCSRRSSSPFVLFYRYFSNWGAWRWISEEFLRCV